MTYLLDTAVCIGFMRKTAPKTIARLHSESFNKMVLCSIVVYELLVGVEQCARPVIERLKVEDFVANFKSLPFDDGAAACSARLRAKLEAQGLPIGSNDMLIAGIALRYDLILVTPNVVEFDRISDLRIENWEA
jgi:tRNA(fMet)-specific endonuclease VapC